ncbi:MAG: NAD(P)/FAD-dependent oxidoreductase [Chloroflexi bacterium]|nr:NAD(P)/FAD-dependent oxidoreductase [Chloroflexota bacterium]
MQQSASPCGLSALEARVHHDLECLSFPARSWLAPRTTRAGEPILDTLIVGGGQCGMATAFGLMRDRVTNVLAVDENDEGLEGPWVTYARMNTLRSPKALTGPDLGIPSLTFRAWYEAQHGEAAWDDLGLIPRGDWMKYLAWYRRVLNLPVRNRTRVESIEPTADYFTVATTRDGRKETLYARTVVLATGIQGGGEWHVPEFISEVLPTTSYAHTSQQIDFSALRGKRVGILGAGPSAFDNAYTGLKSGVESVHLFFRRKELPRINPIRWMEFSGFLKHFADLDDATRYAGIDYFLQFRQPPTNDSFGRASQYDNFHLYPESGWERVEQVGDKVRVYTRRGSHDLDFVIISTGFVTDLKYRPELASVERHIARWEDRYTPPVGRNNPIVDVHPYLGSQFQFTERSPGAAPYLSRIFLFNYGALASLGLSGSAISGMKYSIRRLLDGVTGQLFAADSERLLAEYFAYDKQEFLETSAPAVGAR